MFKTIFQQDSMDCGTACVAMLVNHYGCHPDMAAIRFLCGNSKNGLSMLIINNALKTLGFDTLAVKMQFSNFILEDICLPCIVHWKGNHFIIVYRVTKKWIYTADPAIGKIKYTHKEFADNWTHDKNNNGFILFVYPGKNFRLKCKEKKQTVVFDFFTNYIKPYSIQFIMIFSLLILSSLIQMTLPFMTQAIVDKGIAEKNINILLLILCGQFSLSVGYAICSFLQNLITLKMGTRIYISMANDLLYKLLKLPISFFDTRKTGDVIQRLSDLSRIELFITSSASNIFISFLTVIIFCIILIIYDYLTFLIFCGSSILYITYISIFLRKRRIIDYERFSIRSEIHNEAIQIIQGISEIKLNNCHKYRISQWKNLQEKSMIINIKNLKISQIQMAGGNLIIRISDLFIIFICAVSAIKGKMTLGEILAIQYILGSLRFPIGRLAEFIQEYQDMKNSIDRTMYIYNHYEESNKKQELKKITSITKGICIKNICFSYNNNCSSNYVIKNLNLYIPAGKTTAIVGASGSGKTTLIKLLLGFYKPNSGEILIDNENLNKIDINYWRNTCGTVMQGGFIFSDTIARNVALCEDEIDIHKVQMACKVACIDKYIETLPFKYETIIGTEGVGLSIGQKQRILIARAIYKAPLVAIFDEATNSLDTTNEHNIYINLRPFFSQRTSIIIAHRLSTIKNADNIVIMNNGMIIEQGTHYELLKIHGAYYKLIQDQLI